MSKPLECSVFSGNNPLTGEMIWAHRVNGGSESIKEKLISDYKWDGFSSVATVAANLDDEGNISEWQLHMFGKSKGTKLEASNFYMDQEEGSSMRIHEMALDKLVFRGSMVSEWLSPEKYLWEYRHAHETDKRKYYRVKEADMPQFSAKPLWVRSSCQVIPGPKLKVFMGCAPADNRVTELSGSSEKPFPLIFLETFSLPFLPYEGLGTGLGIGPIPFLIDTRPDFDFSEVAVRCPDGQTIKKGMAKFLQSAIKPNQRNEIKTWQKEHGVGSWVARAPNYTWPNPKPLAGEDADADDEDDDEDDDDAGQQLNTLPVNRKGYYL